MSDSVALKNKEQELKKLHTMRLVRTLLPIVGLIIVFSYFNFLTSWQTVKSFAFGNVSSLRHYDRFNGRILHHDYGRS